MEGPISRGEYRRNKTEMLFGIELLLYRWGLSEFVFDDERQNFFNQDGSVVLRCNHADRDRLFGELRE